MRAKGNAPLYDAALARVRTQHPPFFAAVVADARLIAGVRRERSRFRGRFDAMLQVLRLMWVTDAFVAQTLYRAKASMEARGVPVLPRIVHRLAIATAQVCIGETVLVHPGVVIGHGMIVIDGFVEVGSRVSIMPGVTIGLRQGNPQGPIIEEAVRIGTGAKVLGAIRVGRGAVIAANAVVIDDVAPDTTVAGVPARPLQPRAGGPARHELRSRARADEANAPFLFVHVMRTGGFALLYALGKNFGPDEVYPRRDLDVADDNALKHLSLPYVLGLTEARREVIRVYAGHFPYVLGEMLSPPRPVTLTVLRDPVERTISLLRVFKDRSARYGDATLEEMYEDPDLFDPLIRDHQAKLFSMTGRDAPVSYRDVIEVDESRLALAEENLARTDLVGIYEEYDAFLDAASARFGWSLPGHRANAAEGSYDVSQDFRRRIADDNRLDVEFYAYARELVHRRRRAASLD